jgi:hypothetical protein
MISASDYQTSADSTLSRVDHFGEADKARLSVAEAQVLALLASASAMQDIAAAIDRLATAIEGLPRRD